MIIQGTTAIYTDPELNETLGLPDRFTVGFVASQTSGTSPTLSIDPETSTDGVNWFTMNNLVSAATLSTSAKQLGGSSGYFDNGSKLVRLKLTLGGTTPSTRLKVFFTGRDFVT